MSYPNPTVDKTINFRFNKSKKHVDMKVYNASGQLVYSNTILSINSNILIILTFLDQDYIL